MKLSEEIISKWEETATDYYSPIDSMFALGCPAWVIRLDGGYGVAVPIESDIQVSECFSNAKLYTHTFELEKDLFQRALFLQTTSAEVEDPFASLCAEFIFPGEDGIFRHELEKDPVGWWAKWKELLGNKNVDERVYDVLGELITLIYLLDEGKQPIWQGPEAATYDIGLDHELIEVKSTLKRKKKEITLSNRFQLQPPGGKKLLLYFCQFENSVEGLSIDWAVSKLGEKGMNTNAINDKLALLGLEKGKSARKREYMLHEMTEYTVDDTFPAITENSFIHGHKPLGVTGYIYTVSLDDVEGRIVSFEY